MPLEVSETIANVMASLTPTTDVAELHALLDELQTAGAPFVSEVMEPDQPFEATKAELRDLFLQVSEHRAALAGVGYGDDQLELFRRAIVALLTLQGVFTDSLQLGDYRTGNVEQTLAASLPWRDKLRRVGALVYFLDPARGSVYEDHNATGTIDEEVIDLRRLVAAAEQDLERLKQGGFTAADLAEGKRLQAAADGRNVNAVLGIRNQAETRYRRDWLLTLVVQLARYARRAGMATFWDDPHRSAGFQRASFHHAMRRVRKGQRVPTNGGSDGVTDAPEASSTDAAPTDTSVS